MKEVILLVGHGSRNSKGNDEIAQFADQWSQNHPQWDIDVCFIEFAEVLVDQGLANAAERADRVIVVPLILNAAGHVKAEIPAHIETARKQFPHTEFIYTRHIGATEKVLQILKRYLRSAMQTMDMPDPKNTGIILLGRGSSDRVANGELAKMGRWLYESTEHELVDIAFTGVTHPQLSSMVQRQKQLGVQQIAVLPYYLFSGTLVERIERQICQLQKQYPMLQIAASGYFGFENEIYATLDQRIEEARGELADHRMMECDGCSYRTQLQRNDHHEHHHSTENAQ